MEMKYENLKNALLNRKIEFKYFEDKESAMNWLLDYIPADADIGFGGSMTLAEMNAAEKLHKRGNIIYKNGFFAGTADEMYEKAGKAKYYLTSANAVTQDGITVNMDGRSNRVAAMCYGPENLIYVCGKNKIVKNLEEAIKRIENTAAPLNTKRLNKKTPCVKTGRCMHCQVPERICRNMLVQYYPSETIKTVFVLINENLGY